MNIAVFILFMTTLALVDGLTPEECAKVKDVPGYTRFHCRHVLQDDVIPADLTAWKGYLVKYGLCDKDRPTQSFMKKDDYESKFNCKDCTGVSCTTKEIMELNIVSVKFEGDCKVTGVEKENHRVEVSCKEVDTKWYPVHYVKPKPK